MNNSVSRSSGFLDLLPTFSVLVACFHFVRCYYTLDMTGAWTYMLKILYYTYRPWWAGALEVRTIQNNIAGITALKILEADRAGRS